MGVHSRGVWLCYSVLIIWCATVAVCSPVSKGLAARKRATRPAVVLEPTTVEPAAYDVADSAPIELSKNNGPIDETATLQPEDTSSPLLVSFNDSLLESTDSNNGTFNETADPEDDAVADNLLFACEDDFLKEKLELSDEYCANVTLTFADSVQNEENYEDHKDNYEDLYEDPE